MQTAKYNSWFLQITCHLYIFMLSVYIISSRSYTFVWLVLSLQLSSDELTELVCMCWFSKGVAIL